MKKAANLLAFITLVSGAVFAQNDEPRIFKIELIVFERTATGDTLDPEQWSKNLDLSYPENRTKLINPKAIEADPESTDSTRNMGAPDFRLSGDFLNTLGSSIQGSQSSKRLNSTSKNDSQGIPPHSSTANSNPKLSSETPNDAVSHETALDLPRLREFLTEEDRQLNEKRQSIERTRGLRTLFHQAWFQDLRPRDSAPAILMQGGNLFGDHYELEGSITFSVNRYLHVSTDLWLSSFVTNYGQSSEHWPELPSQDKQYTWQPLATDDAATLNNGSADRIELAFSEPNAIDLNIRNLEGDAEHDLGTSDYESPYLIREIVTLRQKRKMRSNELHYIDHPRIGLLVKITPYTPPEPEDEEL